MRYATGKRSLAICDRCGQRYRYPKLRKEWTGLKTCPDCFGEGVKEVILSIDSLEHLAQEFDYHDVNAGNFKSLEKK